MIKVPFQLLGSFFPSLMSHHHIKTHTDRKLSTLKLNLGKSLSNYDKVSLGFLYSRAVSDTLFYKVQSVISGLYLYLPFLKLSSHCKNLCYKTLYTLNYLFIPSNNSNYQCKQSC